MGLEAPSADAEMPTASMGQLHGKAGYLKAATPFPNGA
jgi:hypothetical protein